MFVVLGEVEFPISGGDVFGREAPMALEIGFGNGWFLEHLGSRHGDLNILGAETSTSSVKRAYRRLVRAGLPNVRIYKGDAVFLTKHALGAGSIRRVYVNFPDPWPRRKHRGKRLLNAGFFELLANRLERGGEVELTTDHAEYFAFARAEAASTGLYSEVVGEAPRAMRQTRYARKWIEQEKPIHHAVFSASSHPGLEIKGIRENEMQHALLDGSLGTVGTIGHRVVAVGGAHVVFMEQLREPESGVLVFLVHVEEEGLKQDILIEAVPREDNVFVGVRRFGSPMATRGVGEAVRLVVEWLETQGLAVVDRWYHV